MDQTKEFPKDGINVLLFNRAILNKPALLVGEKLCRSNAEMGDFLLETRKADGEALYDFAERRGSRIHQYC